MVHLDRVVAAVTASPAPAASPALAGI